MSRRKKRERGDQPREIPMPLDEMDALPEAPRSPATGSDPSMRDGDSGRGNPYEYPPDELTSDNDVGDDRESGPPFSGRSGGAVGGTPAEGRAAGGHEGDGISSSGSQRGDSTIGSR
jgi:hypothetical protein